MALYELSDREAAFVKEAASLHPFTIPDLALDRLRTLEPAAVEVGVFLEGGLVQGVRATSPVTVQVADLDAIDNCAGKRDNDGAPGPCRCTQDTPPEDREEHSTTIAAYNYYLQLPIGVY
jgi:hypothetical protein